MLVARMEHADLMNRNSQSRYRFDCNQRARPGSRGGCLLKYAYSRSLFLRCALSGMAISETDRQASRLVVMI